MSAKLFNLKYVVKDVSCMKIGVPYGIAYGDAVVNYSDGSYMVFRGVANHGFDLTMELPLSTPSDYKESWTYFLKDSFWKEYLSYCNAKKVRPY